MAIGTEKMSKRKESEERATSPHHKKAAPHMSKAAEHHEMAKKHMDAAQDKKLVNKMMAKKGCK